MVLAAAPPPTVVGHRAATTSDQPSPSEKKMREERAFSLGKGRERKMRDFSLTAFIYAAHDPNPFLNRPSLNPSHFLNQPQRPNCCSGPNPSLFYFCTPLCYCPHLFPACFIILIALSCIACLIYITFYLFPYISSLLS